MSLSPDRSCPSSKKESQVEDELDSGDDHLRNERMLPPPLTGPGGAPLMLQDSSGTVVFGLPPDHAIRQEVLFEIPPAICNDKADAAVNDPDHDHDNDNDTDTTLTDVTTGRGAGSVLESIFSDQARAGDFLTDNILHRW
jgi:hypothetical protein